jgi:hypothetical protein
MPHSKEPRALQGREDVSRKELIGKMPRSGRACSAPPSASRWNGTESQSSPERKP